MAASADHARLLVKRGRGLAREASVALARAADGQGSESSVISHLTTDDEAVAIAAVKAAIRDHQTVEILIATTARKAQV